MSLRNSAAAMKNWFEANLVENGRPPWLLWYNDMISDAKRIEELERDVELQAERIEGILHDNERLERERDEARAIAEEGNWEFGPCPWEATTPEGE